MDEKNNFIFSFLLTYILKVCSDTIYITAHVFSYGLGYSTTTRQIISLIQLNLEDIKS